MSQLQAHVLQSPIDPSEREWSFNVPATADSKVIDKRRLVKNISVVSNASKTAITLKLIPEVPNRATSKDSLHSFLLLSLADFRLRAPKNDEGSTTELASSKESQSYIIRLLQTGIAINGTRYHFFGHSNSQLKSRTCVMFAGSKEQIESKINQLGDFRSMKTVAKKAKRIGLLFSSAEVALQLDPDRTEDIDDISRDDFNFTDGCGNISLSFAKQLVRFRNISFRNRRYKPSVYQIRYRGYKGVLVLDTRLQGRISAQFRKSMKKFSGGDDLSFAVVDYSRPYSFGYLNDEIIILLHNLGISQQVLLDKQQDNLNLLSEASALTPQAAFRFLSYVDRPDLGERMLVEGTEVVKGPIRRLVAQERNAMINKRQEQRCRIFIRDSRLLFGVCDPVDCLKAGECFIRVTADGDGLPRTLINTEVLVTRNPCLHPGDLQKFRVVNRPQLTHLEDCIVFSTCGKRPAADLMSGGDLDGDKFFVCWDRDLIPRALAQAAEYPGPPERKTSAPITHQDRLEYFACANSTSLGKVKNMYLEWARKAGPHSAECQQLNRLFSQCVDGNRIRIPPALENPPERGNQSEPFILDVLHEAAKDSIHTSQESGMFNREMLNFKSLEGLLTLDYVALSEMELISMTHSFCKKKKVPFEDFSRYFDYNQLSVDEKAWVSNNLASDGSLVNNALTQSSLVNISELMPFKLNDGRLHWKRVFDSSAERMDRFLEVAVNSFESFHRKLVLFRVDSRLTLAVYIPRKMSPGEETTIEDSVRVFAFPHTGDQSSTYRRAVPTKKGYRVYCDDYLFQMYNRQRRDTWVFIRRAASDDEHYRNVKSAGDKRRARQETLDAGINHDFIASVALNKNSKDLQQHIGRVNRNGVIGAEIYVISNRDIASFRALDAWLEFVDTQDVHANFSKEPIEFRVPTLGDIEWAKEPPFIRKIAWENDMACLWNITNKDFSRLCKWALDKNQQLILLRACKHLFCGQTPLEKTPKLEMLETLQDYLVQAPFLLSVFLSAPNLELIKQEPCKMDERLQEMTPGLLQSLILHANDKSWLVADSFEKLILQWRQAIVNEYVDLFELVSLTVHDMELAEDLLYFLQENSPRILLKRPAVSERFVRSLLGTALDHIEEICESRTKDGPLLSIKVKGNNDGHVCEAPLRIDEPASKLPKMGDHIRLRSASAPCNAPLQRPANIDALVTLVEQGRIGFRCLQEPPTYAEDCSWLLTNSASFVSTKAALDATLALFSREHEVCGVADLLDGRRSQEPSSIDDDIVIETEVQQRPELNQSQNNAVKEALKNRVTCLWGPPGTGKTHTILCMLEKLAKTEQGSRILVTAPTNNAVDNILQRFAAKHPDLTERLGAVRVATDSSKVSATLKPYLCNAFDSFTGNDRPNYKARKAAVQRISRSNLVFTTCIGAGISLLRDQTQIFCTVLIDEASQITEPASYVPLVKGCERAILVGDHVQLRPTVARHAAVAGGDVSLFERLYLGNSDPVTSGAGETKGVRRCMLDTQYRMHADLCSFSSQNFYNAKLKTGVAADDRQLPISAFPWPSIGTSGECGRAVFVQCSTPEDLGNKSKCNAGQTVLCKTVYDQLLSASVATNTSVPDNHHPTIAVLTPYTRQRLALQESLRSNATVSSIDGFQGKEADIVIFVTVRCNTSAEIGFLKDLRRLNVVLTRAKLGLVVVGDEQTLTQEVAGEADGAADETRGVWRKLLKGLGRVVVKDEFFDK